LSKHKAEATKFVAWVAETQFGSRPACKLQVRITKYSQMLFTFLDFDGVSWNNNNAERAIKTFARYRRFADGRLTPQSIARYLIILSVYQTCEFRGIDFLDFLLGWTSLGSGPPVPWILNSCVSKAGADSEPLPGFDGAEVRVQQGQS
jgi:Transposase IS66 family